MTVGVVDEKVVQTPSTLLARAASVVTGLGAPT